MCSAIRRSARPYRPRRGARGISLLEALAATAFMGVALLGFAANSISLTRSAKTADNTAVAHALAQEQLETLRSLPLGAAALTAGNYADAGNPLRADGTPGGRFNRTWVVSAGNTPTWGMKTVTVTVGWRDYRNHSTRIAGYVRCSKVPC